MELIIDKSDLQNVLKKAISATEKKSALPILSNFLLEAKEDKLTVQGTDLEVHVSVSVFAKVEQEGVACVNAKKLTDISRLLPSSEVYIKLEDNKLKIKSGKSRYNLPVSPAEDFPNLYPFPEENAFVISGENLQKAILKTLYATSKEESRFALQGVLFKSLDGTIDVVATDGHRLALYTIDRTGTGDINIIVPQKALNELKRLLTGLEDVEVAATDQYVFFRTKEWILMSRLLEGAFPDYTQVIPKEFSREIKVNKKEFLDAVKRVSAVIEGDTKPLKLTLKPEVLELKSASPEYGEAIDELSIEYSDEEFTIGFNAKYIIEAVDVIDSEEVIIKFTNPNAQTLFVPSDENDRYKAIVMPMEIT
ncbi:MAG: DNA polymerase III subunit beta [Aquificae bacterium]|nr:DNA polymerase III subunit beta [Aquificota bacterium]